MGTNTSVASVFKPLLTVALGENPAVRFEFWDGSSLTPEGGHSGTVVIRAKEALTNLVWAPGELGLARSYVAGHLDFQGDIFNVLRAMRQTAPRDARLGADAAVQALNAARRLGALGWKPEPPAEEAHQHGRRHTKRRDSEAITHHYDVGNDFYELVLGPSLTYSCARFVSPDDDGAQGPNPAVTLEDAQAAKHDLVCRKLGLDRRPRQDLLDVGCGWGSMAIHAATHYEARVVGITISAAQADLARKRVAQAGVSDRVEIRLQDYRDLGGERFDAISSIGMFEHVGAERTAEYFDTLRSLLRPQGRLLNHAISSPGGSRISARSFIGRYVFPDGELLDVGTTALAMQKSGFELRDVEALREHYALTLRAWVANLQANWDEAVKLVGIGRARVWLLYMAASALGFEDGGIGIHQVLGVVPEEGGAAAMPGNRRSWT
ncbi:cyclopropane-fatty-acyl-phospholipid synthase family protein [Catenulispora subtropica]|uniref:Cyclopropane-fatty-acyl-phospholipid synthase family protein n=1 Tax=Catenulispora subtropica TaxID=450798 RepID=A0ABN2RWG4_9ACTN